MTPQEHLQSEIERLEQRFAENPQGRVFAPLADAYRQAGRLEEAEALVVEGLKRHPNYVSAHLVLGRVYLDWGRPDQAHTEFTRVLDLDAQNLVALRALGDLAVSRGLPDEARDWYERVLQVDPYSDEVRGLLEGLPGDEAPTESVEPAAASTEEGPLAGYSRYGDEAMDAHAATDVTEAEEEAGEPPLELEAPAEPAGPEAPEGKRPPAARPPEAPAKPAPAPRAGEAAEEVSEGEATPVTETMAELYAEQGLYEDAIEIYRELQSRRPGEERFARRISELQERARARGAPPPLPTGPDEPLPREQPAPPGPAEPPAEPAAAEDDSLPDFLRLEESPAGADEAEAPARPEPAAPAMDWMEAPASGEPAASESAEMEAELPDWLREDDEADSDPVRPDEAAAPPTSPAPPAPTPRGEGDVELPDWLAEPEASSGGGLGESQAREFAFRSKAEASEMEARDPFAASFEPTAEAEELPPFLEEAKDRESSGMEPGPARPAGATEPDGGSISDYFDSLLAAGSVGGSTAAAPSPPPPPPPPPPSPGPPPPAQAARAEPGRTEAGESEDDLAQFQTWLRSLKR